MAVTNLDRVSKAMEMLQAGLGPFVEREIRAAFQAGLSPQVLKPFVDDPMIGQKPVAEWDVAAILRLLWDTWNDVFRKTLGHSERTLVSELRDSRNKWAHQQRLTSDDVYRVLDSTHRLLLAVSAPEADELDKMKTEVLRLRFEEKARSEKRKTTGTAIETTVTGSLKAWRDVVTPHEDVAKGNYRQAEFAADLWQVHLGEGAPEYKDPTEFFRRTFLTESLKRLLVGAAQRLSGRGGDPVVQLQTNFGGGKTHSMLALYHLFSGIDSRKLPGVDAVLGEAGLKDLPTANRVVLVGNKISPGNPTVKPDGTTVRTLWGELAYQLGGKKAFARIAADDAQATSPGDVLRELFNEHGPCLILIDEWVAYARQLHDQSDLPGGPFETQFTFAQALTESAKLASNCLLVVSLPASDTATSPHALADDVEVGGVRGREALDRLRNVVGRVESSWRPASAEEGFEIVRRRLFQPMTDPQQFTDCDVIARAFGDFYRSQPQEFPLECKTTDYEKRIRAAYPIHPEVFDRLYTDWSTLVKFQRTRGVLRLMAAVIHSLWEKGDRNPLIMPSMIPIDDERVQFELTRYLSDQWLPVISKDVDGPSSLPLRIDSEFSNLGKLHACRRVARTVYLGSAPTAAAAHKGLEDRQVKLGCAMPGESTAIFSDALRRLAGAATYLYQDGPRVWYSTQPTVTKLAEDRAEQLKRDSDKVVLEIERRLRADLSRKGEFGRIHALPRGSADVPDDLDARLVVLSPDEPYAKEPGSPAEARIREILDHRGSSPRLYRNSLVFLAADRVRLQDLDEAVRKYLAWDSILAEKEALSLDPHQTRQAETQKRAANDTVVARLPETYQWLIVPEQANPQAAIVLSPIRLGEPGPLAERASKKLRKDELLIATLAPTVLRKHLDEVPLWRGNHVPLRQLIEDFGRYLYLPRVSGPEVLVEAVAEGVALLSWASHAFAYADAYDETKDEYQALRCGRQVRLSDTAPGLVVRAEAAAAQAEVAPPPTPPEAPKPPAGDGPTIRGREPDVVTPPVQARPTRYHGTIELDPTRVGRDASRVADEVIAHLAGLVGSRVRVTLEIEAEMPEGASEHVVRTVTENSRTLKFRSHGFESS